MAGLNPDTCTPRLATLVEQAGEVISHALAPHSRQAYNRIFNEFKMFVDSLGFPSVSLANPGVIVLYLTDLFHKGFASATLLTRTSALAYVLKLQGHIDPTQHFLVKKFLKGAKHARPSADIRQPMSIQVLNLFNVTLLQQFYSSYYQMLFKCMFNVAFFAFLRPGEMTDSVHNIQFHQVQLLENIVHVTFITFKHHHGRPVTLLLYPQKGSICPVISVRAYIKYRGSKPGPFFANPEGSPVKYAQLLEVFKLLNSRVPNAFMSPHSLRIGAATYATMAGYTQDQVTQMGRWHSDAVLKYFRVPSFKVSF